MTQKESKFIEELRKIVGGVYIDYEYVPRDEHSTHKINHSDHETTLLGDSGVKSNVIGIDNEKMGGIFCHDEH